MFRDQPSQLLGLARSRRFENQKLVNIGGRPVIVSKSPAHSIAESRSESIKMALAFAAIYLVWGSTYLAIRYAVETIPPLVTAGIRHTIAGGVLLTWACLRGYRPRREHWTAGLVLGGLFFLVGHGTLHWAEQHVASGLAALLIATEPMFILVLAWATGQQRISQMPFQCFFLRIEGRVGIIRGFALGRHERFLIRAGPKQPKAVGRRPLAAPSFCFRRLSRFR